jgi:DNA primase
MNILDMAVSVGIRPKWVASTEGGEYHSSCPDCGGNDRFYIQPNKQQRKCVGYFFCRRCHVNGDTITFARKFLKYTYEQTMTELGLEVEFSDSIHRLWELGREKYREAELPHKLWMKEVTAVANKGYENLKRNNPGVQEYLFQRGVTLAIIDKYKIGYLHNWITLTPESMGIPSFLNKAGKRGYIYFGKGITIPTWDSNVVIRMKVRAEEWDPESRFPRYQAISGSMYGLNLIGDVTKKTIIAVESELDAYALLPLVEEEAFVVAVGSNIKNPDMVAHEIIKDSSRLLICPDKDAAGKTMYHKWKSIYPHARSIGVPEGKDIGEAFQKGCDMKAWAHSILHKGSL